MNYSRFYEEQLYPLQDTFFNIFKPYHNLFYLTGGTALSRFYFNHRYSDDLDIFSTGRLEGFKKRIEQLLILFGDNDLYSEVEIASDTFVRIFLKRGDVSLKVDFVNELVFHWGDFRLSEKFGYVDNEMNILANKITAVERYEAKDIIDIWAIAKHRSFFWRDVIANASKKAIVDPIPVSKVIKEMPQEELTKIKWTQGHNLMEIYTDIQKISRDIILGKENSIVS